MPPNTKDKLLAAARKRPILVGVSFLIMVILGLANVLNTSTSFSATGVVSFQPRVDESKDKDLTGLLTNRYPAVATSQRSVGDAALAAGVSAASLEAGLSAVVTPETVNLTLTVTLPTAAQAVAGVQSVYQTVVEANRTDPYLEVLQVQPPTTATEVPGPPTTLLSVMLVGLAAVVAVLLARVVDMLIGKEK